MQATANRPEGQVRPQQLGGRGRLVGVEVPPGRVEGDPELRHREDEDVTGSRPLGDQGRVELEPRGTVTTFTVVEPVQYQGQQEKSTYVVASILLDGAGVSLGQQRLGEIDPDDVRTGMRVEVEWAEAGAASPIKHWGPNGEPDVPREQLQEHIL